MVGENTVECVGCGAAVPDVQYPAFRPNEFPGATSPGCWKVYSKEVLLREYGEWEYPPIHRLTVDTYGAQHPGSQTPRATRSLLVHLVSIHLILERELQAEAVTEQLDHLINGYGNALPRLEPPQNRGPITIVDVAAADTLGEHTELVREWATSVWEVWEHHHATIERWAQRAIEC